MDKTLERMPEYYDALILPKDEFDRLVKTARQTEPLSLKLELYDYGWAFRLGGTGGIPGVIFRSGRE